MVDTKHKVALIYDFGMHVEFARTLSKSFKKILAGANGFCIDPIVEKKFGVQVVIHSKRAEKEWQEISFPQKYRQNIKLHNACFVKGKYLICPQNVGIAEIGAVVTQGDTIEEAIELARKICDSIVGYGIKCEVGSIETALQQFKKIKEFGIKIL